MRSGKRNGIKADQHGNRRLQYECLEGRIVMSSTGLLPSAAPASNESNGEDVAQPVLNAEVATLPYFRFAELTAEQVPLLTPTQVATIPNGYWFNSLSEEARSGLTTSQVQSLNLQAIRVSFLTPEQVLSLTIPQIQSLLYYDFQYLTPAQVPYLTPGQIATIPDTGSFITWTPAARAALTVNQIQALNVSRIRLDLLTPQQVSLLTAPQIRSLPFHEFEYLSAAQTPYLTSAQIATIPDTGSFISWSSAARAALTGSQVQSLNVATIRLELLTPLQIGSLTPNQIRTLPFHQFLYLSELQTPHLTPAQIATIPDTGSFITWTQPARSALTAPQIQALNVAQIRLDLLSPHQVIWLTAAQVRTLALHQFPYLWPSQIPLLSFNQIAAIPNTGSFITWSAAARAALTFDQVRALNVATIRLELLTPVQVGWLSEGQIQSLDYYQFEYLPPSQVPLLNVTQIASIPGPGILGAWSDASRAALTIGQIRALDVSKVPLRMLTASQIGWLNEQQVKSLPYTDFEFLQPAQIPLLSVAQFRSLPSTYNLRNWSDAMHARLTREQILALPIPVYGYFTAIGEMLYPPANYGGVSAGAHHDLDAPSAFANQFLNLTPLAAATHVTIASGNWSDPRIWAGGVVPGKDARVVVSAGTSVRFDVSQASAMFTLRIDGTLKFATNVNTQMQVDTIIVNTHGVLHVGSVEAPIADNVSARIVIADNGAINTAWDPFLWSRGLVSRGQVRMAGREVTPYAALSVEPLAGATTLVFAQPIVGWRVGDELVVGGDNPHTSSFNSDRVRIRAINGNVVTVDPLTHPHQAPDGHGLSIYVANLTRNVQWIAEDPTVTQERPHIAFVHNPDVVLDNIGVYGFGRTDKTRAVTDPVMENGVLKPGTGANARARYSIHFHHTGVDPAEAPAIVRGSLVVGSPGWAYVNHQANVIMENNVAYNIVGAAFVTEDGNEIGAMRGNLAMNVVGSGGQLFDRAELHDWGHGGHGYWLQGPGVELVDNISMGTREAAFFYFTQSTKVQFDAVNLTDPSLAGGRPFVPVGSVPLKRFEGNTAAAAKIGLEIWHHMTFMPDGVTAINDFTSWNSRISGMELHYVGRALVINPKLLGDELYTQTGIVTNRLTHDVTILRPYIAGFNIGIDMPVRRNTILYGGYIAAVQALFIEKGHDTLRTVSILGSINFARLTPSQLQGRVQQSIVLSGEYSFKYPFFQDRRVDSLLSQDRILVNFPGYFAGRLYYHEQTPFYMPFPAATSTGYVPAEYLNKTNSQLASELGISFGGGLLPAGLTTIAGVSGLVKLNG
jgi:DNA polymerase III psi subunit